MTTATAVMSAALAAAACAGLSTPPAHAAKPTPKPTATTSPTPSMRASTMTFAVFATHPLASKEGVAASTVQNYTGNKMCLPPGSTVVDSTFQMIDTDNDGFCPVGRDILDMEFAADGSLIAGYGQWSINTDSFGSQRVAVVALNVSNATWGPHCPSVRKLSR